MCSTTTSNHNKWKQFRIKKNAVRIIGILWINEVKCVGSWLTKTTLAYTTFWFNYTINSLERRYKYLLLCVLYAPHSRTKLFLYFSLLCIVARNENRRTFLTQKDSKVYKNGWLDNIRFRLPEIEFDTILATVWKTFWALKPWNKRSFKSFASNWINV